MIFMSVSLFVFLTQLTWATIIAYKPMQEQRRTTVSIPTITIDYCDGNKVDETSNASRHSPPAIQRSKDEN
jgi:hypothetical protein